MQKALGLWILVIVAIVGVGLGYEHGSNKDSISNESNNQITQVDSNKNETAKSSNKEVSSSKVAQEQSLKKSTPEVNSNKENKQENKGKLRVGDITTDLQGKTVDVEGVASGVTERKGNIFFTFRDPETHKSIKGVIFKKTNNDNAGRADLLQESEANSKKINIQGQIDIYKGELEIKAWKVYSE